MRRGYLMALMMGLTLLLPLTSWSAEFFYEAAPMFDNCGDQSYQKAIKEGLTLGISPSPPYTYLEPGNNKAGGIDVEINEAALKWMGVTKLNYLVMPFGQLIPALLAKRIDVLTSNIHITAERTKVISFTGPAWYYGPAILVAKGNPLKILSFQDLKGKKVGINAGSASENRLKAYGITPTTFFQTDAEEFAAAAANRVDAIVDDDIKISEYLRANPSAPLQMIQAPNPGGLDYTKGGIGYNRYGVRKEDCTLRVAFTQALAEMYGNGLILNILKEHGLTVHNVLYYLQ